MRNFCEDEFDLAKLIHKLEKLSSGESCVHLLNLSFPYGQEINFSEWESGEREVCLSEVKETGNIGNNKIVFAGFCKIEFWLSQKIKRNYRFVPENADYSSESAFNGYLNSAFIQKHIELHRAEVTGIKADSTGKELVIQYKLFFDLCEDLPFIRMKHLIPNSLKNEEEITKVNFEIGEFKSQVTCMEKKVQEIAQAIVDIKIKIKATEDEKNKLEKFVKENKKAVETENEIKSNLGQINKVKNDLEILQLQKNQLLEETLELESRHMDLERKESEKIIELKKLSLMIRDQLQKNIPQSLFEFINIVYDIESQMSLRDNERSSFLKQEEKEIFENFSISYEQLREDLDDKAFEYLNIKL